MKRHHQKPEYILKLKKINVLWTKTLEGDCDREGPGKINFSNKVPSSTELSCQEIEESSPVSGEGSGRINFSNKVPSSTELSCHEIEESSPVSGEGPGKINFSNKVPSSTKLSCHEIEESSPLSAEDENFKSRFIFRSSSAENFMATRPRDSTITAQSPLGESISSDNLISPYNEQLEQFQKSVLHGLDLVSSVDTLENALEILNGGAVNWRALSPMSHGISGSLVGRLVFLPFEESSYATFARSASDM
ncbi:hypothetical protein F0562_031396 [Nyssa sinensis]|uniref:Uncharacterized protein n=1 Tax=Nyssa sinensis TaxID=561372 RepID=A0A5J5AU20_9ASTE|nr:hypothetical protein F0562_031396 [Nyssa sinensis]